MAAKVFEHLTFDKGKTVKEVYKILNRCMAEEKTVRISRKAMLFSSIARQRERLDKYIDLCADGIITKQELAERRKGLDKVQKSSQGTDGANRSSTEIIF